MTYRTLDKSLEEKQMYLSPVLSRCSHGSRLHWSPSVLSVQYCYDQRRERKTGCIDKNDEGGAGRGWGWSWNRCRALTELLKQQGAEGSTVDTSSTSPQSSERERPNGTQARILRSRSEQYHLNNSPFGPGLPHAHSNQSNLGLNKYTSLKAVADSASHKYYKSYPLMDFSQYQPVAPPTSQSKEKSYLHQPLSSALSGPHNNHPHPVSISIPSTSHPEHSRLSKTTTHPLLSSSAFTSWEPSARHVQRQTSAPGHDAARMHNPNRRHTTFSARRKPSSENVPDLFSPPYGAAYGNTGQGPHHSQGHPPQMLYSRPKSFSTHSATEVTV
uniref:Uncharacterized protein n=1 Tax=Knipowitschia caucasica TaxID=637954 RepID=A0AAV2LV55_KNICA